MRETDYAGGGRWPRPPRGSLTLIGPDRVDRGSVQAGTALITATIVRNPAFVSRVNYRETYKRKKESGERSNLYKTARAEGSSAPRGEAETLANGIT